MMRQYEHLAIWLVAVLLLTACSSTAPEAEEDTPVQAVRAFVAAVEARDPDQVLNLIEPTEWRRGIGPEVRASMGALDQIEFHDAAYTLIDQTDDVAHVRVTATVHYTMQETVAGTYDLSVVAEVVRVDDTWYLRDISLPGLGREP